MEIGDRVAYCGNYSEPPQPYNPGVGTIASIKKLIGVKWDNQYYKYYAGNELTSERARYHRPTSLRLATAEDEGKSPAPPGGLSNASLLYHMRRIGKHNLSVLPACEQY